MPFDTDGTTSYTTQEDTDSSDIYRRRADGSTPETEDGTSTDEVDPRKLMKDPDIDSVRWLARTSFGGTIVKKPIKDAFKHGFDITDETGREDEGAQSLMEDLDWEEHYVQAQIKARRDGFALVYAVLNDDSDASTDPFSEDVTVDSISKLNVLSLDDLAKEFHGKNPAGRNRQALPEGLRDDRDIEIRKTGLVVDMDPNSDMYKEPVGVLVGKDRANDADDVEFLHRNRIVHHLVWEEWVDHDLNSDTLGEWEGDSVLISSYHILRGLKKGNWSIMQTLFRYAAKLYHIEMPEDADEDDWDEANENLENLNALSEFITPAGYEVEDFGTDGQLEPEQYFNVLFDQICASNEMTKSVLFGTQSGTVSGSEVDIKNYFNKVERMRTGRIERDMQDFITWHRVLLDDRTKGEYEAEFEVEWGPLFKMTELDKAEMLSRRMQTLSAAINNFVMTPQEARNILQEDWAEANIDWEDEFTEEEEDFLKTLNIAQLGTEAALPPEESNKTEGNPRVGQNGGGREPGPSGSQDPTSDAIDYDRLADAVAERLSDGQEVQYEF